MRERGGYPETGRMPKSSACSKRGGAFGNGTVRGSVFAASAGARRGQPSSLREGGRRAAPAGRRRRDAGRIRGQLTAAVLSVMITLMTLTALSGFASPKMDPSGTYRYYTAVRVESGDTLFSIAQDHMSREYRSVREYVRDIMKLNGMHSTRIYYGQNLIIPYYSAELK